MTSWSKRFAAACCTISLAAALHAQVSGAAGAAPAAKPSIALLDPTDAAQWKKWTADAGWLVIAPDIPPKASPDERVKAVAEAVRAAIQDGSADPAQAYVGGRGDASQLVFYAISRVPDLWAAGVALGGSPKGAILTGLIFASNFKNVPVLWLSAGSGDEDLAKRLKDGGLNVDWRNPAGMTNGAVFEWLGSHRRDPFPKAADCETNSPQFAGCFWLQPAKFDPGERNDVLPSTRIDLGSGAALDVGSFGFNLNDPGPGVLVTYLPDKYDGPLKKGDRITEMDGKPIATAKDYVDMLNRMYTERPIVVMVERGKNRTRLETYVVVPKRDSVVTSRVQASFDPEEKHIEIVSRTVTEMQLTLPADWAPADLYWNGLEIESIEKPGCYLLTVDKELLNAAPCSK